MNPLLKNVSVINLDKDTERLRTITQNLSEYGISFTRSPAIYGKDLSNDALNTKTTVACRKIFCNHAIIGSGLSHISLWKQISERKEHEWFLILEDDVKFHPRSVALFDDLWKHLQKHNITDALVNVNCHNAGQIGCTNPLTVEGPIARSLFPGGISAYVLTPKIAKLLVEKIGRIQGFLDNHMAFRLRNDPDIPYFVTRERFVFHDYNIFASNNSPKALTMPLLAMALNELGAFGQEVAYHLNIPIFTFDLGMRGKINVFTVILVILLILAFTCFRDSKLLKAYLIAEVFVLALYT